MTVHIPTLLEGILEATAAEAAAKARIATLRAALEDEARRRYATEGAAPSWHTPALGKVRLDPDGDWTPTVADPDTFASYAAEHFPTEVTALIPVPAADLEDVLKALEFIGVTPADRVRLVTRSAWEEGYVKALAVDVETIGGDDAAGIAPDRVVTVADPETGQVVPGMTASRKPARLVVSLDRERRTAAITTAQDDAAQLLADASGEDAPGPDAAELHARRVELEDLHGDALAAIAKAHGLGSSGTKAALAERVARAELATGHTIRPASTLPTPEVLDQPVEAVGDPFADEEVAAVLADEGTARTVDEHTADDLDTLSREALRAYAKSIGLPAAGTKADVIARLTAEGVTVATIAAAVAAAVC